MMKRLEAAARQALEALEYVLKPTADFDEAVCQKLHDTAITALREALAEQQAAQQAAEPVGYVSSVQSGSPLMCGLSEWERKSLIAVYTHPTPTQQAAEPVANLTIEGGRVAVAAKILPDGVYDLYTEAPTQQPLTIPRDVVEAAQLMQDGDYRGPLFLARKVFDWVAAHDITIKEGGAA